MNPERWHPIQVAAARSGLTQHAIRAWERRYGAVKPRRTPTNRRLYSDDDVRRLSLLHWVTQAGWSVGQVAHLPTDELGLLLEESEVAQGQNLAPADSPTPGHIIAQALRSIKNLDGKALEALLYRAEADLGTSNTIDTLIAPLIHEVGEGWREGSLRIAHEHLASSAIRTYLSNVRLERKVPSGAASLVCATPAGQWHELGALMAAAVAAVEGWHVTHLGPNLPVEEIVTAARTVKARIVALSIVYPGDDPMMPPALRKMRKTLPEDTAIAIGGRAASDYAAALQEIGAVHVTDMPAWRVELERHHGVRAATPVRQASPSS
ncbi:MAG: cobalamin-dependent protein [Candidatus Hydrogenedentes bacterium]|nr:cobalamin-dependent protein [Candidatus Hydrogenedentota bacterium]